MGWAMVVLAIGMITTGVLAGRALVGDRSRGRRRCPSCWYDMGASPAPGLVCPECGKDAKREPRLFRSRRRKRWIAASFLPLVAGMATYGVWFARQPDWIDRTPSIALILASPWLDYNDRKMGEALLRRLQSRSKEDRLPEWERWLQGRISLRMASAGGNPLRVLLHVYLAVELGVQDDSTTAALLGLLADPDARIVETAAGFLRSMRPTDKAEVALVALIEHANREVQSAATLSLAEFKRERRGGPPPELLLADAAQSTATQTLDEFQRAWACQALGGFDASPRSREVLLQVAETDRDIVGQYVRRSAVIALTMHYPDDAYVLGLLLDALREREDSHSGSRSQIVERVLGADRWFLDDKGELLASRRALYSDAIRAAMIDASNADMPGSMAHWDPARRLMRSHPCFSPEERARVRVDEENDRDER